MRDDWWDLMSKREAHIKVSEELDESVTINSNQDHKRQLKSKFIAIYHLVFANENFDTAAKHIYELITHAQKLSPGQKRILYLDIEGHRNDSSGFDHDMFKLQKNFLIGFMMPYLTEIVMPLMHINNTRLQKNDLPDEFVSVGELTPEKLSEIIDKYESFELWLYEKNK